MSRTDYGAVSTSVIQGVSNAIRNTNHTVGLIAPAEWGSRIRAMHSSSDYDNVMAQLVEETTTPASIASFTDGANNIPVKELVCTINPVQSGTGDPSPSNERPITGHTEINITQQSTIPVTDNAPYLFRQSGGDNNADVYSQETDKLVGASAVVNQLVRNGNFADTSNWTTYHSSTSVANNELTETVTSGNDNGTMFQDIPVVVGHKYFVTAYAKVGTAEKVRITYNSAIAGWTEVTSSTYTSTNKVGQATNSTLRVALTVYGDGLTGMCKNFNVFDLTAMFGTTIADYIYSLEQGTAGSGIAYLRKYGFFTKGYYPYTANALQSVNTSKHITVGLNQWDEQWELGGIDATTGQNTPSTTTIRSKNYIKVTPNTVMYVLTPKIIRFRWYDQSKTCLGNQQVSTSGTFTIPSGCYYIRFVLIDTTTYANNVCVNISDASKNGTYEAYVKHEYALPNIDLRGLYKLDASNNLYADGDTLEGDGTLTRKYGIVDLGTLSYYRISTDSYYYCVPSGYKIGSTNFVVAGFTNKGQGITKLTEDKTAISFGSQSNRIVFRWDEHLTDTPQQFATAMSGIYLVYELATPTTEQATGFTNPQLVDKYGTEEYTDERNFPLPVGHETIYLPAVQREHNEDFGQTVYGCSLNVTTGVLTVTHAYYKTTGNETITAYDYANQHGVSFGPILPTRQTRPAYISNMSKYSLPGMLLSGAVWCGVNSALLFWIGILDILNMTLEEFKIWIVNNPLEVAYELKAADQFEIQLDPIEVRTLLGSNNIYHDCNGDIAVTYRANGALYVAQH